VVNRKQILIFNNTDLSD